MRGIERMKMHKLCLAAAIALFSLNAAASQDPASPVSLLKRMETAHASTNFDNNLVRQTANDLLSLRVSHGVVDGTGATMLSYQNGLPRGVVELKDGLVYFEPNESFFKVRTKTFPNLYMRVVATQASELLKIYSPVYAGQARVAGQLAQRMRLDPRSGHGYSLMLSIDRESGILLELDVLDEAGGLVERFMSVNLNLTGDHAPAELTELLAKIPKEIPTEDAMIHPAADLKWQIGYIPSDYRIVKANRHAVFGTDTESEYMLISDGLTDISVYLTKHVSDIKVPFASLNALTVFRLRIAQDYDVAVIGRVPPEMAKRIAESIIFKK